MALSRSETNSLDPYLFEGLIPYGQGIGKSVRPIAGSTSIETEGYDTPYGLRAQSSRSGLIVVTDRIHE